MTKRAFLSPDVTQIRHQIRGILESYSHDWDILAELAQNAVDAIVRHSPPKGHVTLTVDADKKKIVFQDNGIGIDPADLEKLLRPFATDKYGAANQIGNKGVGLTFILFSSSRFELETHSQNGSAKAVIVGAKTWLENDGDDGDLLVDIDDIDHSDTGTKITLTLADDNSPLREMTTAELVFALRTRTALGNTGKVWSEPLNCDAALTHIDLNQQSQTKEFECDYLLPTEGLPKDSVISVQEFTDWRNEKDRTDADKRVKLKDKVVVDEGKWNKAGRNLKYWSCFMPNRNSWNEISKIHGLVINDDDDDDGFDDGYYRTFRFSAGLVTSSKGMPTGIALELKPRGSAGYFPNYFILIEDPSLSFDIGRKSIQGRQQGMLRDLAYSQFRKYINDFVKYISGNVDKDIEFDRDELIAEIDSIANLGSDHSRFVKRPNSQEATVAALFYEQIGKGGFPDFSPLISGYKGRYDLWGKLGKKYHSLEFKFDLRGLLKDVTDEVKMFDELNTLVVWDITEADRNSVERRGLALNEIGNNVLAKTQSKFPNAHYRLDMDGVRSIEIVCMRKLLKPGE